MKIDIEGINKTKCVMLIPLVWCNSEDIQKPDEVRLISNTKSSF